MKNCSVIKRIHRLQHSTKETFVRLRKLFCAHLNVLSHDLAKVCGFVFKVVFLIGEEVDAPLKNLKRKHNESKHYVNAKIQGKLT